MGLYRVLGVMLALASLAACSQEPGGKQPQLANKLAGEHKETTEALRTCAFSNKDFAYAIDSCNCGDIYATYDTIAIELFPPDGGEIQGRLLKINYPECDSSNVVLMYYQNRGYISSMGPDPVLTDWVLYTSPVDTIHFDPKRKGFYIDTIPQVAQVRFPPVDTLALYQAYQRAVGHNLHSAAVPDIAKGALYQEYKSHKAQAKEIAEQLEVELHRIILVLKRGDSVEKVLLFNYGHSG